MTAKKPLRSAESYGPEDKDGFIRRSWMKSRGFSADILDGRPVMRRGLEAGPAGAEIFQRLPPCGTPDAGGSRMRNLDFQVGSSGSTVDRESR